MDEILNKLYSEVILKVYNAYLGGVDTRSIVLASFFAAIPIFIWLYIFFNKIEKSKKTIFLVFAFGCLVAPTLLYIQELWDEYPSFNLQAFIEGNVQNQSLMVILILLLFVVMEEFTKLLVVKFVDQKTLLINKLNDAIRYSITAALAFAFTENIYYLTQFWPSLSQGELVGMYIFRSIFTACAHMIFTGIFGYYYGIGKFSIIVSKENQLLGGSKIAELISKTFNLPISEGYRQKYILKGFFLAILLHFTYNYTLELGKTLPAVGFVILGFLYLQYLLNRKAGHLILTLDPTIKSLSTIAKKDSDVIIELLGMWFQDKRYVDVLHICERLLERDPDNKIVKLFKAKAMDKMDDKNTYKKILGTILKTSDDLSENEKNIISKYTEEKENLQKVKKMVKEQIEKEGKKFIEPKTNSVQPQAQIPEKESQTFKINI